jgi:hypothetical protein
MRRSINLTPLLLVACTAAQPTPSAPADSSEVTAKPSTEAPTEPSVESAAPSAPVQAKSAEARAVVPLLDRVARRDVWPLDPDAAQKLLQPFAPQRREEPALQALSLVGGPSGPLVGFQVAYSQSDRGGWSFSSAGFDFSGANLSELYAVIRAQLVEQLGEPAWVEPNGDSVPPSAGWEVGHAMQLLFAPRPNPAEKLLVLSISEPQGEEE